MRDLPCSKNAAEARLHRVATLAARLPAKGWDTTNRGILVGGAEDVDALRTVYSMNVQCKSILVGEGKFA